MTTDEKFALAERIIARDLAALAKLEAEIAADPDFIAWREQMAEETRARLDAESEAAWAALRMGTYGLPPDFADMAAAS